MQRVEICLKGQINDQTSGWYEGLRMSHPAPGETILTGIVSNPVVLFEVITHLRAMGIEITAVTSDDLLDQNPP